MTLARTATLDRAADLTPAAALLDVADLTVRFRGDHGWLTAVGGVSFSVAPGEIVGIVGESGSGKTQILMALMGLLASNGVAAGSVRLNGDEILNRPPRQLDLVRGSAMTMVFQDPMTSLNPFMRIGRQLTEVLVKHHRLSESAARKRALDMLELVRIPEAQRRFQLYPHEFSGGMRQRVMISMALLCRPTLLLADEPTTALDVTIQAQILELLDELSHTMRTAVVIVTHDLGVVASLCDRVIVLYGGRIMESASADLLFSQPAHPYTQGLLRSTPRLDEAAHGALHTIPGQPPSPLNLPPGCPFEPRCELRVDRCAVERPALRDGADRRIACHRVSL